MGFPRLRRAPPMTTPTGQKFSIQDQAKSSCMGKKAVPVQDPRNIFGIVAIVARTLDHHETSRLPHNRHACNEEPRVADGGEPTERGLPIFGVLNGVARENKVIVTGEARLVGIFKAH